jgi:hypothetical protein
MPAEGRIVHRSMRVGGVLAQIVEPQIKQAARTSPTEEALSTEPVDKIGKDGEHVDTHDRQAYEARYRT